MTHDVEQWQPVLGYEGYYEVSDLGRVRSLDRISAGRRLRGRTLRMTPLDAGRFGVKLCVEGRRRTRRISVLVLEAFVGPRPLGCHGCHNDGDPSNNRLSNLRWDTPSENRFDTVRHGRHQEVLRTHCPRSHPLADPNLSPSHKKNGRRVCLACHRALCARRRARLADEPFDMQRESDEYYNAIMRAAD